jgi:hypothetical protein
MTEFDFDVITGPSGPMRRGTSACGWTPAEEPEPSSQTLPGPFAARSAAPERERPREAGRDA